MKWNRILSLLLCLLLLPLTAAQASETITLRVYDWLDEQTLKEFSEKYPYIQIEQVENLSGTLQESIVSGAPIDVYAVSANGSYAEILRKGYAAPLENDALLAKANRLLPALQSLIMQDGHLMAFPSSLSLNTWTLDVTGWEEAGYAEADAPQTIAQFLSFFADWQENKNDDFADRYFFEGSFDDLIRALMTQYIAAAEQENQAVSFDNAAFRDGLALLDEARPLFQANTEKMNALMEGEFTPMPLIYAYNMSYGYTGLDDHTARPLAIPALDADTGSATQGTARLWFVSANSQHPREAALLIDYLSENARIQTQYELYQDMTSPLENERFPALLSQRMEEKEQLKKQIESSKEEEKQALEERLSWVEDWLGRQDEVRWSISQKDIDLHQSLTSGLFIPTESLCLAQGSNSAAAIDTLIERFAAGELTASSFIEELDRVCRLAFGEQ